MTTIPLMRLPSKKRLIWKMIVSRQKVQNLKICPVLLKPRLVFSTSSMILTLISYLILWVLLVEVCVQHRECFNHIVYGPLFLDANCGIEEILYFIRRGKSNSRLPNALFLARRTSENLDLLT